jgi:endonuclease YncB( thermonuclease family)
MYLLSNKFKISLLWLCLLVSVLYTQTDYNLGEFTLSKIIDGDTFRFEELKRSTRLLGIDTEETYKDTDAEIKAKQLRADWNSYYLSRRDSSGEPVKIESPFGFYTWQWAKEIMKDVRKVRLEIDEINRVQDIYGRYLVYVIAIRNDGSEFNYNVECVRNGYSPYFTKYGYSKRYHKEFTEAQNYARENRIGIWNSTDCYCYPDYDLRMEWWNQRAEQIKYFEENHAGRQNYFSMLNPSDYQQLKNMLGDTVIIFGSTSRILNDRQPWLVKMDVTENESLELVFFRDYNHIVEESGINSGMSYYYYVKGKLSEYKGRLQIIIEDRKQIWR